MLARDSGEDECLLGCAYCCQAFPERRQLEVHQRIMHAGMPFSEVTAPLSARERGLLRKAPTAAISNSIPLSEVSRHCTPEDCWVGIEGKVYDLTEFMDRHPGGSTTILNWAGKDATKMFRSIHRGIRIDTYLPQEAFIGYLGIDEDLMTDDFWHALRRARVEEIQDELQKLETDIVSASPATLPDLLRRNALSPALTKKLETLAKERRAALASHNITRAQAFKAFSDKLLTKACSGILIQSRSGDGGVPLSEVRRHNKPSDCWVALREEVYDFTDFLLEHPEHRNSVLAWAGRDATRMWNKMPGRFPSEAWCASFMRPEYRVGHVGPEPKLDPKAALLKQLRAELRRLQGPDDGETTASEPPPEELVAECEEARFPEIAELSTSRELPLFSREQVARHSELRGGDAGSEPYVILHNKVYDLTPALGSHPGGDEVLLSRAGTDVTREFELLGHSQDARVRREREMLVGLLVPAERSEYSGRPSAPADLAPAGENWPNFGQQVKRYFCHRGLDLVVVFALLCARRRLRLISTLGVFGWLASESAASSIEGRARQSWVQLHGQMSSAVFLTLTVRLALAGHRKRLRDSQYPVLKVIARTVLGLFYARLFLQQASS